MTAKLHRRHPFQLVTLTAGENGDRDLVQFGGGEHEIDMGGWLLQGLEQGVEGLGGEHVHFIDDNDAEPG